MNEDLGFMTWYEAVKACADLEDRWRLPTIKELKILYKNKAEIGGFAGLYYWSSTPDTADGVNKTDHDAWGLIFKNGIPFGSSKYTNGDVRAVRDF